MSLSTNNIYYQLFLRKYYPIYMKMNKEMKKSSLNMVNLAIRIGYEQARLDNLKHQKEIKPPNYSKKNLFEADDDDY